jgi:hypothetical protein
MNTPLRKVYSGLQEPLGNANPEQHGIRCVSDIRHVPAEIGCRLENGPDPFFRISHKFSIRDACICGCPVIEQRGQGHPVRNIQCKNSLDSFKRIHF